MYYNDLSKIKNKDIACAEMYFYNEQGVPHGVDKFYGKYWTNNFDTIFKIV